MRLKKEHTVTGSNNIVTPRTEEQTAIEAKFVAMGHRPEDITCDHSHYRFDLHGRHCMCGSVMVDFGD